MPATFQIVRPEATTNLITNPSIEGDAIYFPIPPFGVGSVRGWEAVNSTLAVVIEPARFGTASLQVVTNGVGAFEGTYFRVDPGTQQTFYAGSVYVRGEGTVRARLVDSTGGERISDDLKLTADRWQRIIDVVGQTGGAISNDLRLYIETVEMQAVTFYVDGGMIEPGTYTTTYTDGDQEGCTWNVIRHASTSDRSAQERSGGRLIDLDEESIGIYITIAGGIGTPPLRHNVQGRALLPGVEYQSTKVLARVIQLAFWAKNPGGSRMDLKNLHEKRQELIDLVKLDVVSPTQPFILRYNGGRYPLDIECLYEAGLEFDGDIRNPYFNSFVMRMLCTDPFWVEDNQEAVELDLQKSLGLIHGLLQRIDGDWLDWGGGLTADYGATARFADEAAAAPDGRIYIGGRFDTVGGVNCHNVAYWDGENWNPLNNAAFGPGLNGTVHAVAIAPDGRVYIGGNFNDVEGGPGATYSNIVLWNPVTETFAALGTGLNGVVLSVRIALDGQVYVGGNFTDVVGGAGNTLNHVARWDPDNLTWNGMGAGAGVDNIVEAVQPNPDGTIVYIGGRFDAEFGGAPGTLQRIASYDVATNTITELGGGTSDTYVAGLAIARNGDLYIAGDFTTIGGVSANYSAVWNGSAYSALGTGLDSLSNRVSVLSNGIVWYGGGVFTQAGNLVVESIAAWNGSAWFRPPLNLPQRTPVLPRPPQVQRITDDQNILYIVGNWSGALGQTIVAAVTEVDNIGASEVKPVVEVMGPGILYWLENITTGAIMYLNYDLKAEETLTIDFRSGTIVSSWVGNILDAILPQSNFSSFSLLPGINKISFFMDEINTDSYAQMRYIPQYESVDGTVR